MAAIDVDERVTTSQYRDNVHDINVRWHSCDMCEKKFKIEQVLNVHCANMHDIDVRWHSCDMCEL